VTALPKASANRSTAKLTHYGRKTGKPYSVTIWFVVIDGKVWIGSLKRERSWVKNVRAVERAELDFGLGPVLVTCRWAPSAAEIERFDQAVRRKYFIMSHIIGLFVKADPCAFETDLVAA
jgi:deazaflavin-dependent oxidoreductase (nitroreductase family)